MIEGGRSLNLSNCVAIVVYEVLRQRGYEGLSAVETIKGENFLDWWSNYNFFKFC